MLPSAAVIVARFLRANGYDETLATFIKEAGLASDIGSTNRGDVTIEQILQEKKAYDLSLRFEKLGVKEEDQGWRNPAPAHPIILDVLPSSSNILSVHIEPLAIPDATPQPCILVTTADRRLSVIRPVGSSFELTRSYDSLQDSPILDIAVLDHNYLLLASMSGKLVLYDLNSERKLEERRDHSKYIVQVSTWTDPNATYIATAGWDSKVILYSMDRTNTEYLQLGRPAAVLDLPSVPEVVQFLQPQEPSSPPLLLVTRRDSTFLYYYSVPRVGADSPELYLLGQQNLAPHASGWVSFTPSAIQVCPTDPSILAVATSSIPHMKLIVVRLLVPPRADSSTEHALLNEQQGIQDGPVLPRNAASLARAELTRQNHEESAIVIQCSTLSPQSPYSTPAVTWRPDGSGVWVNSDDGIIRGIETSTGKTIAKLEAHEAGSKIRCLCSGIAGTPTTDAPQDWDGELLVSGGFDRRLIIWKSQ